VNPDAIIVSDPYLAQLTYSMGQGTDPATVELMDQLALILTAIRARPTTKENSEKLNVGDEPLTIQDALSALLAQGTSIKYLPEAVINSVGLFEASTLNPVFPDIAKPYLKVVSDNVIGINNTATSQLITSSSMLSRLTTISNNTGTTNTLLNNVVAQLTTLNTTLTNCLSKLISIQTHTGDSTLLQQSAVDLLTDIDDVTNDSNFQLLNCNEKLSYDVCTKIITPIPPHVGTNYKFRQTMSVSELVARAGLSLVPLTESSDGLNKTLTFAPVGIATAAVPADAVSVGGNFEREPQLIDAINVTAGPNTVDQFTYPVNVADDPWIRSGQQAPAPQVPGYKIKFA